MTILLPVTEETTPARALNGPRSDSGGVETILVVEDEAAMRELSRRILLRSGYHVLVAAN